MPNCPFYGCAHFQATQNQPMGRWPAFILMPSMGNQCGLVSTSHTPCLMEIEGNVPDWKKCTLVKLAKCKDPSEDDFT